MIEYDNISVECTEAGKTFLSVGTIVDTMLDKGFSRHDYVVTIGGGIMGDMGGFVAGIYMRGLPLFHIPTTLISQVDSCIGGKVGVNSVKGKNALGMFVHPQSVLIDPGTLLSLDERNYLSGIAEIIKYGLIRNPDLVCKLEQCATAVQRREIDILRDIIWDCILIKKQLVEIDEKDFGIRRILNYGHTLGHAIESNTDYKRYLHGEAISIGIAFASHLSVKAGYLDKSDYMRIIRLLDLYGLPSSWIDFNPENLIDSIHRDKKRKTKNTMILLKKIGETIIDEEIEDNHILESLKDFRI
jgi:3-dehydroquinate synthase